MSRSKFLLGITSSWLTCLILAFVLGAFRTALLEPRTPQWFTELFGVVALVAMAIFIALVWIRKGWLPSDSDSLAMAGVTWATATILFELLFFHYAMGVPWEDLLENFDLSRGKLFVMALLLLVFAPLIAGYLAHRKSGSTL